MTRARRVAPVVAAVCAAALAATVAQAIEQRAAVVAGGAQESSGGGRQLVGTVGQGATGTSSSGAFVLCSGYWCLSGAALVSVEPGPGGTPAGLPRKLELGPISPQPARGPVHFAVGLPRDAELRFEVFDVAGRPLGEPVHRRLRAGRHTFEWSLRDQPAGVYFARIAVDGVVRARSRIVIVP